MHAAAGLRPRLGVVHALEPCAILAPEEAAFAALAARFAVAGPILSDESLSTHIHARSLTYPHTHTLSLTKSKMTHPVVEEGASNKQRAAHLHIEHGPQTIVCDQMLAFAVIVLRRLQSLDHWPVRVIRIWPSSPPRRFADKAVLAQSHLALVEDD
jgi:hypothetical protein